MRVILFASRNKDNKHIAGFKERRKSFVSNLTDEELIEEFSSFVEKGVEGEFSRLYVSINTRDEAKVHKAFMHWLIDHPDCDLTRLESKVASLAAKPECRETKRWMFDFDEDESRYEEFARDVYLCDPQVKLEKFRTPNGLCVVADRGFDTRGLKKWANVELKKDAMRCLRWGRK